MASPISLPYQRIENFPPIFWRRFIPIEVRPEGSDDDGGDTWTIFVIDTSNGSTGRFVWRLTEADRLAFARNAATQYENMSDLFRRFETGLVGAVESTTIPATEITRRWREQMLKIDRELLSDSERENLDKPLDGDANDPSATPEKCPICSGTFLDLAAHVQEKHTDK